MNSITPVSTVSTVSTVLLGRRPCQWCGGNGCERCGCTEHEASQAAYMAEIKRRNLKRQLEKAAVNLTPHEVRVLSEDGEVIAILPTSGTIARVGETATLVSGIVWAVEPGAITGLPAPVEGKMYVCSGMVAAAAKRKDVVSPYGLVRDSNGQPIGCKGFCRPPSER